IAQQFLEAFLDAEAALLPASVRLADVAAVRVDPDVARLHLLGGLHRQIEPVGDDCRGQPVLDAVHFREHVRRVGPGQHRHHRAENLFPRNAHFLLHAVEHRRPDEESIGENLVLRLFAAGDALRSFLSAGVYEAHYAGELALGDDRAELVRFDPRKTDRQCIRQTHDLIEYRAVQRFVHEDARSRAARLALPVHVHSLDRGARGLLRIRVGEDDDRVLAAELERHALQSLGRALRDEPAGLDGADEPDAIHQGVRDELGARDAIARDDVHHARREEAFGEERNVEARKRRLLRALDDDRVPGRERRSGLLDAEAERMVERVQLRNDAVGLATGEVHVARPVRARRALDLGDQAGEVLEGVGGPVHVAFHALHRVARIDGVDQREALRLLAHALRPRFEALRALLDADLAPLLEALRRRLDGKVDVLRIRVRHVAELRACRWTDRGKAAAARRLD